MYKKTILLIVGLLCCGTMLMSQSVQNSVVASSGASASAGNVKMDYTVGEIVVETFTAGGNTLTQGFHQTNLTLVAIENAELFSDISLYPNPASDVLNVDIPAGYSLLEINLYDVTGKLLLNRSKANGALHFDVAGLATGTYYLQITDMQKGHNKTFKIVKSY